MDSPAKIVDCLRVAITDAGLAPRTDMQLRHIIGLGLHEAIEHLYPEGLSEAELQIVVDSYRQQFLYANRTPSQLFEGVETMLQTLRDHGYYLAVATGKSRAGLDRVLEETGLNDYFHLSRCADETRSKPDPQMLLEILTDLDMAADRALMIGDTEFDIEMARRAGMHAVAVGRGAHGAGQLRAAKPLVLLEDVTDLLSWLTLSVTQGDAVNE
jgi:phosphoglycolate phosphatase